MSWLHTVHLPSCRCARDFVSGAPTVKITDHALSCKFILHVYLYALLPVTNLLSYKLRICNGVCFIRFVVRINMAFDFRMPLDFYVACFKDCFYISFFITSEKCPVLSFVTHEILPTHRFALLRLNAHWSIYSSFVGNRSVVLRRKSLSYVLWASHSRFIGTTGDAGRSRKPTAVCGVKSELE